MTTIPIILDEVLSEYTVMTSLVMCNPLSKPQSVYGNFRLYNTYKTLKAPLERNILAKDTKTLKVHIPLDSKTLLLKISSEGIYRTGC